MYLTDEDRMFINRMVQVRSRTVTRKESAEIEGATGELAFAKYMGLEMPEPRNITSDGGVDFTLSTGATVDVKSISGIDHWRLGLLVPKRIRSGIYVLVHVTFSENEPCTIIGWQTGAFAVSKGQDKGDHYRVHQRDLKAPVLLKDLHISKGQDHG